jgi:hypothetical protein
VIAHIFIFESSLVLLSSMTKFRLLCGLGDRFGRRRRAGQIDKDQAVLKQNVQEDPDQTPTVEISRDDAADALFQYLPLDRSVESTFRLVTLLPGPKGSQPRCTLSIGTWRDGRCSYEALSYVWGDSEARRPIILDGKIFEVTVNLFSALSHLQLEDRPRVLWIDAICIDQDSIQERNHQVASMGGIYGNCQKVVIWLGDEDNETESAVDFIKSTVDEIEQRVTLRSHYRDLASLIQLYSTGIEGHVLEELFRPELLPGWTLFHNILQRTWWTRTWVVQEFANAPDASFHIGNFSLDWTLVSALIIVVNFGQRAQRVSGGSVLSHFEYNVKTINMAANLVYARLATQNKKLVDSSSVSEMSLQYTRVPFLALLRGQSHRECSDLRDKVYSILSMTDASLSKVLLPNYSKPVRWTYIAAVRTYIIVFKNLDIIGYNIGKSSAEYPSWCSDWNTVTLYQHLGVELIKPIYNTSGPTEAVATFSKDESTIYLKGFLLCTVIDNCFQESQQSFCYPEDEGFQINWDIKLMARKLQRKRFLSDTSPSTEDPDFSAYESDEERCFNTVASTILAGSWNKKYIPTSSPPVKKDRETGEWWPGGNKWQFLHEAAVKTIDRTVVLGDDGKLGLAPKRTDNGDEIWIFMGATTPFVLRKVDEVDGDKKVYRFIGNAYVHGVMKGEAMVELEKEKYELETVALV